MIRISLANGNPNAIGLMLDGGRIKQVAKGGALKQVKLGESKAQVKLHFFFILNLLEF